ncbi:winged helix-turn-helix transcriptional regulator [Spirillospora sp. CA-142024]|uniref:winged helix-turn-helix transcriptional regulator n=1 Tax=Spirillospora sp. CA-142024 TaxID=3240036 RepID=UPI003D912D07
MAVSTAGAGTAADENVDTGGMCPSRLVMEHVTSRWAVLILIRLLERPHRFGELRRSIRSIGQISEKMLARTLQTLERDGFVHRDAKPVVPPHVDYSLTELGHEAAEQIRMLALWSHDRMHQVQKSREMYDAAKGRP